MSQYMIGLMENSVMSLKRFDELMDVHSPRCVSIYMPTHRAGKEGYDEDRIRFKDLLKEVRDELIEEHALKRAEVEAYLKPAQELVDDSMFWSYSGDGLACFLSEDRAEVYRLPIGFEPYHSVSDNFYLHPLFPFFNGDGRFYVIGVTENSVRFWEGSRYRIREVPLTDNVPKNLKDAVGYDHEEKAHQERSFKGGSSGTIGHGHGEGKDDEKAELEKFFRDLDHGLSEMLHDEHVPLVFAGVEHYFGLYRKVAHYRQLQENGFVKGNPERLTSEEVHSQAWELVKERFDEDRSHYIQQYQDSMGGEKAVYDNSEVLKASVEGRVEALFIEEGTHLYGIYDQASGEIRVDGERRADNEDLVEVAAMNTYRKDGRVFILSPDRMPEPGTQLDALLRY